MVYLQSDLQCSRVVNANIIFVVTLVNVGTISIRYDVRNGSANLSCQPSKSYHSARARLLFQEYLANGKVKAASNSASRLFGSSLSMP